MVQNILEDVFALARRQVVEKVLRRHLDEPNGKGRTGKISSSDTFVRNETESSLISIFGRVFVLSDTHFC